MKEEKSMETVFESENIVFVKLSESLVEDYLLMVNDPDVQSKISHKPKTYTLESELKWIRTKLEENAICYSMLEKSTGKYIGNIEIMDIKDGVGELGISITPQMQDKHFGTESIKAIIDYAYNILGLQGLELNVYSSNPRAIHCYEKIGFVRYGQGRTEEDIHMKISR